MSRPHSRPKRNSVMVDQNSSDEDADVSVTADGNFFVDIELLLTALVLVLDDLVVISPASSSCAVESTEVSRCSYDVDVETR